MAIRSHQNYNSQGPINSVFDSSLFEDIHIYTWYFHNMVINPCAIVFTLAFWMVLNMFKAILFIFENTILCLKMMNSYFSNWPFFSSKLYTCGLSQCFAQSNSWKFPVDLFCQDQGIIHMAFDTVNFRQLTFLFIHCTPK